MTRERSGRESDWYRWMGDGQPDRPPPPWEGLVIAALLVAFAVAVAWIVRGAS